MRPRLKKAMLVATAPKAAGHPKIKRSTGKATPPARNATSKKTLKKLLNNKITYKPFSQFKETTGTEGNYHKLIYNTPKY